MYACYEKPMFSACLLYFDNNDSSALANQLQDILKEYGFYPPGLFFAADLTRNRYVRFRPKLDDLFVKAYSDKDALTIEMFSSQNRNADKYWDLLISKPIYNEPSFSQTQGTKQWNALHLSFTYEKLNDKAFCARFLQCVKALIVLLHPFFARLDDVAISTDLMLDRALPKGISGTLPTEYGVVQAVYWGNYYGPDYCNQYLSPDLFDCAAAVWEPLWEGMFFTITEDMRDFCSPKGLKNRKLLTKKLSIQPIHPEAINTMEQLDAFLR